MLTRAQWRAVVILGLCQNALYLGLNWVAMQWIEAGLASIIAATMPLIVTPDRCYLPPEVSEGNGIWGISAQLYLLRSRDDWGLGDFADLKSFVGKSADLGASVIGLNPLHTMFPDNPDHASPYSPASRLYLNILYIDPAKLPEYPGCERCRANLLSSARRAGFSPQVRHSTDDSIVVQRLITHGGGVALMPETTLEAAPPTDDLVVRHLPDLDDRMIGLINRRGALSIPAVAALKDALVAETTGRLATAALI